jgi:ABC-2 type transport system permease protein
LNQQPQQVCSGHAADGAVREWLRMGTFALVERRKLRHDRTGLVARMVQPALWLLIFGQTFSHLHVLDTGSVSYLAFLAPGIIAQSALFISIFYGTPAPASALITGKAFAAGVRSVAQVVGMLVIAYLMGVHLTINPRRILAAMGVESWSARRSSPACR